MRIPARMPPCVPCWPRSPPPPRFYRRRPPRPNPRCGTSIRATTDITLFGTIHALPPGTTWLSPRIAARLDAADTLVLETVLPDDPAGLAAAGHRARLQARPAAGRRAGRAVEARRAARRRVDAGAERGPARRDEDVARGDRDRRRRGRAARLHADRRRRGDADGARARGAQAGDRAGDARGAAAHLRPACPKPTRARCSTATVDDLPRCARIPTR